MIDSPNILYRDDINEAIIPSVGAKRQSNVEDITMLIEQWKTAKLSEGVLPETIRKYEPVLRWFIDYLQANNKTKPTRQDVEGFLSSLRQRQPSLSDYRIRNYWVSLSSFYTWAESAGLLKSNPMNGVKAPKLPKNAIEIYTSEEIERLLKACANARDRMLITMYLNTGARATELLEANIDERCLAHHAIKLQGKGNKERIIPFNGECTMALTNYFAHGPHEPIGYQGCLHMLYRTFDAAGVRRRSKCIHCFRHTFACNYLLKGGSPLALMHILGHSSLTMVNRYSQWVAQIVATNDYRKTFDRPNVNI
ncbi:MAG: tyrosine-type recombinase/integrase [Dehalococcoidia bacterium]|nr:tyrosine-type recombinase/integrase [Dehalococcoidia bacterium]